MHGAHHVAQKFITRPLPTYFFKKIFSPETVKRVASAVCLLVFVLEKFLKFSAKGMHLLSSAFTNGRDRQKQNKIIETYSE